MVMPMSEHDTDFPTRYEDSAVADTSRSTAEFRAFANRSGSEGEAPWSMRAPGHKVALFVGIVIVVAVVLIIIAVAVLNA
jgi:hypothetical protein